MLEITDPHHALAIRLRVKDIVTQPRFFKSDLDKLAADLRDGHYFYRSKVWTDQEPYFRVLDGLMWKDLGSETYDETIRRIAIALDLPEDVVKPLYIAGAQ